MKLILMTSSMIVPMVRSMNSQPDHHLPPGKPGLETVVSTYYQHHQQEQHHHSPHQDHNFIQDKVTFFGNVVESARHLLQLFQTFPTFAKYEHPEDPGGKDHDDAKEDLAPDAVNFPKGVMPKWAFLDQVKNNDDVSVVSTATSSMFFTLSG